MCASIFIQPKQRSGRARSITFAAQQVLDKIRHRERHRHQTRTAENDIEDTDLQVARYKPNGIQPLLKSTKFTRREIQLLYRGFKQECPSGIVNKDTFRDIYQQYFPQGNSSQYANYVFNTFDHEKSGSINFEEFVSGLSVLSRGSITEKLHWAFTLYDINHDGHITREEMLDIVSAIYEMIGRCAQTQQNDYAISRHVDTVFHRLDVNQDGIITMDEFMDSCLNDEGLVRSLGFLDTMLH